MFEDPISNNKGNRNRNKRRRIKEYWIMENSSKNTVYEYNR